MSDTLSADARDTTMEEPPQKLALALLHRARRSLLPFVVVAAGWEAFAHFGSINQELFPPIETVVQRFWELLLNGILADNTWSTIERLLFGWIVAAVLSLIVGFLMARLRPVEEFFLPLISVLIPIPSIAWVPIFILWFGLGNTSVVILVIFSSSLPMTLNIWTGMRSVRPVWLRAARSFEVDGFRLFRKVVLPGSLPFVMTAFRIGAAQAWRAVIAGEMVAATQLGLGIMIFNSRQFLETDVMLSALLVIGPLGYALEKVVFQRIERHTIGKWGMIEGG